MIISVEIQAIEPLADGAPFGSVGAYEKVIGVAKGEVDPDAPGNKGIALIDKAPRNARGMVEYTTDFFVLRPKDPAKGNGRILYEVNNRGRKMLFGNIADGPQGMNDPQTHGRCRQRLPDAPGLDDRLVRLGSRCAARQQGPRPDRAGRDRQSASRSPRPCARNGSPARAAARWRLQALLRSRLDRTRAGRC